MRKFLRKHHWWSSIFGKLASDLIALRRAWCMLSRTFQKIFRIAYLRNTNDGSIISFLHMKYHFWKKKKIFVVVDIAIKWNIRFQNFGFQNWTWWVYQSKKRVKVCTGYLMKICTKLHAHVSSYSKPISLGFRFFGFSNCWTRSENVEEKGNIDLNSITIFPLKSAGSEIKASNNTQIIK